MWRRRLHLMKAKRLALLCAVILLVALLALPLLAQVRQSQALDPGSRAGARNALLEGRPFIQIPGPNPILTSGRKGEWDESVIEACDVIKDFETYYFYYHGVPKDTKRWPGGGYRVGLATAKHPLGPWTKYGTEPVLTLGPEGSWEDRSVACAFILKEAPDKFYMWYSGGGRSKKGWSIGLATASKPEGPWKKYGKNPLIEDFGYVGGVVKYQGKYHLYTEHPIGSTAPDYGPIALATADSPEGPWMIYPGNPVIPAGERGAWDDGGYSEAKVTFWDGVFHIFYGAAKEYKPRMLTRESIGYAYSFDGTHFIKYGGNPVARREANPNAAAFSEVHTLFEPPFVYAFHTLRYIDEQKAPMGRSNIEDLGVQVLAFQPSFRLPMPVLNLNSLAGGASTKLADCPPISLESVFHVSLTAEASYAQGARAGMRVRVRSSPDGMDFDTADVQVFENDFRPGARCVKTVDLNARVRFIKVIVENLDKSSSLSNVKITATLGS